MLASQLVHQPRPIAAAVAFAATMVVALFAVFAMQTPRDRRSLLRWLGQTPGRLVYTLTHPHSPVLWYKAVSRRPRLWGVVAAAAAVLVAAPLVAYRVSPRLRLGVVFVRVSDRAQGPTLWAPVIREGRPALPFLISQFTSGETTELHRLNRRLDAVLRLTLDWLHWRQHFVGEPLPAAPAGRWSWESWWRVNGPRVPQLGRDDPAYERWRRERMSPWTR